MTKDVAKQPTKTRRARWPRGGGVYVDGERVEGTEPAETTPDAKRVAEREARKAAPIKEKDDA